MSLPIQHPLATNVTVVATRKTCQCRGGKMEEVTGKVLKVIRNQSGFWYYLDTGITIKSDQVTQVFYT